MSGQRWVGRDVPDEVSVVGYDDSALMNRTDPPLTAVRQPVESMVRSSTAPLRRPNGGRR